MLPYLERKSAPVIEVEMPKQTDFDELDECAEEILNAIASKSKEKLKDALQSFFEICESYPHEENSE